MGLLTYLLPYPRTHVPKRNMETTEIITAPTSSIKAITPDWVKDAVFYEIFPDRFAKSERVLKPHNLELWDTPPTAYGFKGGDLLGVVEHLD